MTVEIDSTYKKISETKSSFPDSVDGASGLTMSSLEVAGLTQKRHDHIMRDIRKMLTELEIPAPKFGGLYRGENGKDHPLFNLPKRETLILVSGYSTEMRARIIDRWMVLEAVVSKAAASHDATVTALDPAVAQYLTSLMKATVHTELETVLPKMVESALVADTRAVATEYKPALSILMERKVPPKKRRGFSQKVSSRLRKYSTVHGLPMRLSRETGRYLFHVDAIGGWMSKEGRSLIAEHLKPDTGQTELKLVPIKRA